MSPILKRAGDTRRLLLRILFVLAVACLLVGFRLVQTTGPEREPDDRFRVVEVVDGDTFLLYGGDRVRLLGVDTPEEGERFHDEATALLDSLVLGRSVRLSFAGRRRDHYGRLLAFAYVDDSIPVNRQIVEAGMGYLYLFGDESDTADQFAEMLMSQREALKVGRGMYGQDAEPEESYLAARGSHRFHRPWCQTVSRIKSENRRQFIHRDSALWLGLSPCRDCRP